MKNWIIMKLGLRGSWKWAQKQLIAGKIIRRKSTIGTVKHRLDLENQQRLQYTYARHAYNAKWTNAIMFLSDFRATDWIVFEW